MKNLIYLSVLTALGTIMIACELDYHQPEVLSENQLSNPHYISIEQASVVSDKYVKDKGIIIPTRGSEIKIKESFSVKDNDGSSVLHAINYEGGGFTLISCDNRLTPVLAFSKNGTFEFSETNSPFGLKVWLESVSDMIKEAESKGKEQEPDIAAAWTLLLSEPLDLVLTRSQTPEGWPPPEADTTVGPFLNDSWHQQSPYNDYLYPVNYNGTWYQPPVGCVPLSIARIMRHHQYPSSFLWSLMPSTTPQTAITKSYIADIYEAVSEYCQTNGIGFSQIQINNNPVETYVQDSFPIDLFLQNQYGYPSPEDIDYSPSYYQDMRRDLIDHHLPCIIRGYGPISYGGLRLGHAWICDGYYYDCTYAYNPGQDPLPIITTHLHYCWGDTSTSTDGWYNASNVTYNNTSYQYNMKLTRHISPVDYWPDED